VSYTKGAGSTGAETPEDHYHGEAEDGSNDMATPRKSSLSPAFQFYPKDFLTSAHVVSMSLTERGAYIVLLSHCWLDVGLPNDPIKLSRMCGLPLKQFVRMWTNSPLQDCFYEKEGRLFNHRLDEERRKQAKYRKQQKDNAEKRWHSNGNATAMPSHMPRQSHGNALLSPSSSPSSSSDFKEVPEGEFQRFQMAYPESRRMGGYLAENAFFTARQKASLDVLLAALTNHKASEQWKSGKIPGMASWLKDERWLQKLEPEKPSRLTAWRPEGVA
jgi:uncharacterized protein YdaU (DUF1376 family)